MTALNLHDDTFAGVLRFQFVQEQPGSALLKLLPGKDSAQCNLGRIQAHFAAKLGNQIDLQLDIVDQIPLTRVGKQPMIVQRCAIAGELLGDYQERPNATRDAALAGQPLA